MQKDLQLKVWQFILAYKKHTGERVNYLELATQTAYRERVLEQALHIDDPELQQLASEVSASLHLAPVSDLSVDDEEESESLLLSEAPISAWSQSAGNDAEIQEDDRESPASPLGQSSENRQPASVRYAYRLRGAMKRGQLSLLHRRALDRFARKHQMSSNEILTIENTVRSRLKRPDLSWEDELAQVIAELKTNEIPLGSLRKQLQQTYVRADRMNELTFQRIYQETPAAEKAQPQAEQQTTNGKSPSRWIVLGTVAALVIGLITATGFL